MPRALWDNMLVKERVEFDWLECACCSVPYAAGENLGEREIARAREREIES